MPETLLLAGLLLAGLPLVGFLAWLLREIQTRTTVDKRKANLLDLTVEEYILRLLVEKRQLRELLNLREKDWDKKR